MEKLEKTNQSGRFFMLRKQILLLYVVPNYPNNYIKKCFCEGGRKEVVTGGFTHKVKTKMMRMVSQVVLLCCFSNASFVSFLYIKAHEMVSQWFMLPK